MIDDAVLPAAAHLTGAAADDVLRPAAHGGGLRLLWCRPNHVQYRPGSDLVVRYRVGVVRSDGRTDTETLLAATTVDGPPAGTLPVEARTAAGVDLEVGVWRWPFDPALPALGRAVTPDRAEQMLTGVLSGPLRLEVVAYRPTERAVVRVAGTDGEVYLKVVPPEQTAGVVERHERLRAAGLPVPAVLVADEADGWVAMEALHGATLRDRIVANAPPWPPAARFRELFVALAGAGLDHLEPVRTRVGDAVGHAAMLATVLPAQRSRLAELASRFEAAAVRAAERSRVVVHGDVHEAQVIVRGDEITGLLDIDDVGPGDPLDDMATLLGHLRSRARAAEVPLADRAPGPAELPCALHAYADRLRSGFAEVTDPDELDVVTAAVITGLATGPFRVQQPEWPARVTAQLEAAEELLDRGMRGVSARAHGAATPVDDRGVRHPISTHDQEESP